jgi:DNA-binding transcriptional LysR family regulator
MVRLGSDELVAMVAPQHELARHDRLHPRELKGQRLIVPNPGNKLWAAWDAFLIDAGVFPEIIVETDDLDVARQLVMEGHGVSVSPRWAIVAEIERGELRAIPLGDAGVFRQWCLAYHHGTELAGARRNFLKVCHEEVPRLLGATNARRREVREDTREAPISDDSEDGEETFDRKPRAFTM